MLARLVTRHYHGYRIDHSNRGAQREAVYTIAPDVRLTLARSNRDGAYLLRSKYRPE
ncbi:hypothetical protein Q4F19_08235 [Sphingomonas sp. BIUV-7]|uniref:Uncharacterized protein n=1 Tax=Sphingomonas natans TaxID=3063330 RepID=A0ABT8Y7S4_9SPHN|nr:hypothetical protein [Sphingomonas sp. BIUV-7]MDO6414366.1 hypothetical protein [Sphingomonas sp. BIUV-7]